MAPRGAPPRPSGPPPPAADQALGAQPQAISLVAAAPDGDAAVVWREIALEVVGITNVLGHIRASASELEAEAVIAEEQLWSTRHNLDAVGRLLARAERVNEVRAGWARPVEAVSAQLDWDAAGRASRRAVAALARVNGIGKDYRAIIPPAAAATTTAVAPVGSPAASAGMAMPAVAPAVAEGSHGLCADVLEPHADLVPRLRPMLPGVVHTFPRCYTSLARHAADRAGLPRLGSAQERAKLELPLETTCASTAGRSSTWAGGRVDRSARPMPILLTTAPRRPRAGPAGLAEDAAQLTSGRQAASRRLARALPCGERGHPPEADLGSIREGLSWGPTRRFASWAQSLMEDRPEFGRNRTRSDLDETRCRRHDAAKVRNRAPYPNIRFRGFKWCRRHVSSSNFELCEAEFGVTRCRRHCFMRLSLFLRWAILP